MRMATERIRTSIPVEFEGLEVSGSGVIQNMSRGGLFVGSRAIPPQGEPLALRFDLPGAGEVAITAMVWWTTDQGDSAMFANPGFGLRVIDENRAYTKALSQLIR